MNFPVLPSLPVAAVSNRREEPPTPAPAALIPLEQWREHAKAGDHTTLPDNSPLSWTADAVLLFERMTGSLLWPQDVSEAFLFLWAASLTAEQHEALWQAPLPVDDEEAPAVRPAMDGEQLRAMARAWYRAVIPAGAGIHAFNLAIAIWNFHNAAAVEVDVDSLPDDQQPPDEKKNPAAVNPIGSSAPSMPSAEATPPAGPPSAASHGAPSSALTAHGSPPTGSPSFPPPPRPEESGSSTRLSGSRTLWCAESRGAHGATVWANPLGNETYDFASAASFECSGECLEWIANLAAREIPWHVVGHPFARL